MRTLSMGVRGESFLKFRLDVDRDGWPPVGAESIPVKQEGRLYEVKVPPLFVKDISVGDRLEAVFDDEGYVARWTHQLRSGRSTIWVLKGDAVDIEQHVEGLKRLRCNIERLSTYELYSIDIPAAVSVSTIDEIMARIKADGGRVAYPSFRH